MFMKLVNQQIGEGIPSLFVTHWSLDEFIGANHIQFVSNISRKGRKSIKKN